MATNVDALASMFASFQDQIKTQLDANEKRNQENLTTILERVKKLEKPTTFSETETKDVEGDWNDHSDTPYFSRKIGIGERTVRRQSSLFNLTEVDDLPAVPSGVTMTMAAYVVPENEKVKFPTLPAVLYGMEKYKEYLKIQPEAKNASTRKPLAQFFSRDVLEEVFLSEKAKRTDLSLTMDHTHDLVGLPNDNFVNALARFLRPDNRSDLFDVIKHTVAKMQLPKIEEYRDGDNEYSLRVEGYDKKLFKPMDQVIRTVFDSAVFLYRAADAKELSRLPLQAWGKPKEPQLFLLLLDYFIPYEKSVIKALGGMETLIVAVKELEELRTALNGFNVRQAQRAKALAQANAEFQPVKSIDELRSAYTYKEIRKTRESKPVKGIEELSLIGSTVGSPLPLMDTSLEYGDTFQPPEEFVEGNLILATYQPRVAEPAKDFCSSYFWRGECEAGDKCVYKAGHSQEAVSVALEKRIRSMVTSSTIGADMIVQMLKKVKDNPQPSSPSLQSTPSQYSKTYDPKSTTPPPKTPTNTTRFTGNVVGGGVPNTKALYDPSRSGNARGKPSVRLVVGDVDCSDVSSSEVAPLGLAEMD